MSHSKTYKAKCICHNCKTKFFAEQEEDRIYHYAEWVEDVLEIPLGTKIGDVKCPKCGCQTLSGEIV